jgi:hypothetical protein
LLYGTGVLVGGVFTVPVVRLTGALFMVFGFAAVLMPPQFGNLWLGAGFGVLQTRRRSLHCEASWRLEQRKTDRVYTAPVRKAVRS